MMMPINAGDRISICISVTIHTQESTGSFMHRSNCCYDSERPVSETRGAQSGNGPPNNEHARRLSHTTDHGPKFEKAEKSNESDLVQLAL
jgi:hypothetical protein